MNNTTTNALPDAATQDALKRRWQLDNIQPAAVLELLPRMDRVMIALRGEGFLHERLGVVASVTLENGDIVIKGEQQDVRLPDGAIVRTVLDISTEMRGKLYPRLEFLDADDQRILSVTGLEGVAPINAALADIPRQMLDPAPAVRRSDDPAPEIAPDDPGLTLLERLSEAGARVQIRALNGGAMQRWNGVIEEVMPMGGHINVITSGFHLHLAAGTVAHWENNEGVHRAMDKNARPIGLEVDAP